MVNEQVRRNDDTGGLTSLFVSMIELGDAATKFTFNQMQNAVDMFINPVRAIDRARDSMNNFSRAMYRSAGSEEPDAGDQKNGHAGQQHANGSHRHEQHAEAEGAGETLSGRKL